jgi:hypothetical protein
MKDFWTTTAKLYLEWTKEDQLHPHCGDYEIYARKGEEENVGVISLHHSLKERFNARYCDFIAIGHGQEVLFRERSGFVVLLVDKIEGIFYRVEMAWGRIADDDWRRANPEWALVAMG